MSRSEPFYTHMESKGLTGKEDTREYDLEASDYLVKYWKRMNEKCGCPVCKQLQAGAQHSYDMLRD